MGWGFQLGGATSLLGNGFCRNHFQGGVGFSTSFPGKILAKRIFGRNPFQGGVGFSTGKNAPRVLASSALVAIPFRVGWGFQLEVSFSLSRLGRFCRNPFQGGVGFSTV